MCATVREQASAATSRTNGLPNKHHESSFAAVAHASISNTDLLVVEINGRNLGPEQIRDLTDTRLLTPKSLKEGNMHVTMPPSATALTAIWSCVHTGQKKTEKTRQASITFYPPSPWLLPPSPRPYPLLSGLDTHHTSDRSDRMRAVR